MGSAPEWQEIGALAEKQSFRCRPQSRRRMVNLKQPGYRSILFIEHPLCARRFLQLAIKSRRKLASVPDRADRACKFHTSIAL